MEQYKKEFIEFMVRSGVLTFGDFTTKSGRKTPFFINTGNYSTGEQLTKLGEFYAAALRQTLGDTFDVLFGPAYKGIPLVVTTAIALARQHNQNVVFCFNRKEVKDHGEGGNLIGHRVQEKERVVIVEDVTTAGTSVRESIPLLQSIAPVTIRGLIVSVDRMERGLTSKSALMELHDEFGITTFAIVNMDEVTAHLHNKEIDGTVVVDDEMMQRIDAYRDQYGACQ
jgi:orotate phosphoribosyltransferase